MLLVKCRVIFPKFLFQGEYRGDRAPAYLALDPSWRYTRPHEKRPWRFWFIGSYRATQLLT